MCAFKLILLLAVQLVVCAKAAEPEGPQSIQELVARVFPEGDAPQFQPLPSTPQVAVASNDSAILQIMDLKVSALPIKPGYTTFQLHHFLAGDLPANSQMELVWFSGNSPASQSKTDICPYLAYAKLNCPVRAYKRDEVMQQVLQVPEMAAASRVSFIAKVTSPRGALVAHIAAIIDLVPGDATRSEQDESLSGLHDEL